MTKKTSKRAEPGCGRIFSGVKSFAMWDEINKAKTVEQLKWALYTVCCRLQELETIVRRTEIKRETK